jgi:hypothetical protein
MNFELHEDQIIRFKKWQVKLKKKYGEYGTFTYKFTPFGMGTGVEIERLKTGELLDLSDIDKW